MKDGLNETGQAFTIDISQLIALGHIVDDFEKINSDLKALIADLKKEHIGVLQLSHNILMLSKGKHVFQRKTKKFYHKHEKTIQTIMKYTGIVEFIAFNYNNNGELLPSAEYFYQYLVKNRDKIKQILTLLEHLKKLGFRKLQLDANLCEQSKECMIKRSYLDNFSGTITYSDGIQILPSAVQELIKYNIVGGNYIMSLFMVLPVKSKEMLGHAGTIIVQNLLFDVKLLPEDLSKENTFGKIIALNKAQAEKNNTISQSVHLSVLIDGFSDQYNYGMKVLKMLEDTSTKEELIKILEQIRTQLDEMQMVSMRYDDSITQGSDGITKEQLQTEKRFYLERQKQL